MAYVDLSDVKSYLGVSGTGDDTEVQRALDAASAWVDNVTERTFTAVDPSTDSATQRLYQPDRGVTASAVALSADDLLAIVDTVDVDTVETQNSPGGSWETLDVGNYELRPLNADAAGEPFTFLLFSGSRRVYRLRVTGWHGWPAVPDAVREATMLQTAFLYRRREAPFGISQTPDLEGGGGMRLRSKGDPNAESLLEPYVRRRVVFA